ncbi:MAG TPA: phosphatidylglycerophosphatase A [Mariprofundaceae bacterium]|nr:phosphatidylglycerophosphatase A [Mariprofundaceae bacterium]
MTTLAEAASGYRFIAAGFGSGWLPKAPGTWGSLVSLAPGWLLLKGLGVAALLAGSLLLLAAGCFACYRLLPQLADKDPGWIVIDEWAGQWFCLMLVSTVLGSGWLAVLAAFAAFRLFDVSKLWPVSVFERLGPPWWSIMADDMAAGFLGGVLVAVLAIARAAL